MGKFCHPEKRSVVGQCEGVCRSIAFVRDDALYGKSKTPSEETLTGFWCPGQESNLHASRHTHLKRARLPIPPPGQLALRKQSFLSLSGKRDLNPRPQPWQGCALPTELLPHCEMLSEEAFLICGCKGSNIFRTTKTFQGKSEKNAFFFT